MWHKSYEKPPDVPETENFGIEYEVQYRDFNGQINVIETEWLTDKTWNCHYPVIAWREINKIVPFAKDNIQDSDIDRE